jgi:hypothetical protein
MELVKGMQIRTEILQYSLLIENFSSIFLSNLLNITDYRLSKSIGNKSSNLSFKQKIDLLIDIQALENKEKNKFSHFMAIRNQFMHNLEANSYENCFKNLDGAEKFLLKTFPQDFKLSKEKQLEFATKKLAEDVITITVKLMEKIEEKIREKVNSEMLERYQENSTIAITEIENKINSAFTEKLQKGEETINLKELKELGSYIRKIYYRMVIEKTIESKK